MISSRGVGDNGERVPGWFRIFLKEYRADREATGEALKVLAESIQHVVVEVRDLGAKFHQAQKETNTRLDRLEREQVRTNQELARTNQELARTNQELARTRRQSAKLFVRLISEVKALGRRP